MPVVNRFLSPNPPFELESLLRQKPVAPNGPSSTTLRSSD